MVVAEADAPRATTAVATRTPRPGGEPRQRAGRRSEVDRPPASRAEAARPTYRAAPPRRRPTIGAASPDRPVSTPRKEPPCPPHRTPGPAARGCRGPPGASSCWARRRRSSSRRATTPRRWTTSPTRAGVSKPVLYQHFPGKLDLYLALLDQHAEAMVAAVRAALASTTDNKLRVAATIEAYFRFVDEDGGAFRLVFESDLTNQPAVRERVDGVTRGLRRGDQRGDPRGRRAAARSRPGCWRSAWSGMAQVAARYWLADERRDPAGRGRRGCWPACPGAASAASPAPAKRTDRRLGWPWPLDAAPARTNESRRSPWRSGSVSSTPPASW